MSRLYLSLISAHHLDALWQQLIRNSNLIGIMDREFRISRVFEGEPIDMFSGSVFNKVHHNSSHLNIAEGIIL